jgi:N-acyl-D-amino-acid deacylase
MNGHTRISASRILNGFDPEPFSGHVIVHGDMIADIIRTGPSGSAPDASQLQDVPELLTVDPASVLAPGFIDLHSHSDLSLVACPDAPSKLAQGVTTEVVGNCGFSAFPDTQYWLESRAKYGADLGSWESAAAYLRALGSKPTASNVCTLVGLGAIRTAALGADGLVQPDDSDVAAMKCAVSDALQQGAIGVSSGLFYAPGCFASQDEMVSILSPAGTRNGPLLYATHLREESVGLLGSIDEALEIAQRAEIRLHIAHLKAKGRRSWRTIEYAIERIADSGVPVTADVYPYTASMTRIDTLIPRYLHPGAFDGALTPALRRSIIAGIELSLREREGEDGWERITIAHHPAQPELERQTIAAASAELGVPPAEAVMKISLDSKGRTEIINHCLLSEDVDRAIALPWSVIASDGYALPLDSFGAVAHPRSFGTFPRFIKQYVVDRKALPLGEAIRKITSAPADIAGLPAVGRIAKKARADMVVIRPSAISDEGDYEHPNQLPSGIEDVVVAGRRMKIGAEGVLNPAGKVLTR